jgi:hypothetical protein
MMLRATRDEVESLAGRPVPSPFGVEVVESAPEGAVAIVMPCDMAVAVVPGSRVDHCSECLGEVFVARTTPDTLRLVCLRCAPVEVQEGLPASVRARLADA